MLIRRYMARILSIRRKTQDNQSINQLTAVTDVYEGFIMSVRNTIKAKFHVAMVSYLEYCTL